MNNLFAYTEKDAKNIGFELVLNKSGVNKIYYAKSASIDEDDNITFEVAFLDANYSDYLLGMKLISKKVDLLLEGESYV